MYYLNDLDDRSRQIVEEEVNRSGESLWWVGKPQPFGIFRAKFSIFQLIFGLFFFGVIYFMFNQFMTMFGPLPFGRSGGFGQFGNAPSFFPYLFLGVLAFIALSGLRTLLSPLWAAIGSLFTIYAITSNRAMIINRFPRMSVTSYYPQDFASIQRTGNDSVGNVTFAQNSITIQDNHSRSSGSFTINFGNPNRGSSVRQVRVGFLAVSRPREVEEILGSLVESTNQ